MPPGGGHKSFIHKGLRHLPQTNSHFPFDKPIPAWYNTRMKYSKRRNQSYKMPEMDKDYVLNNLDLAVRLLENYELGMIQLEEKELNTPEITDRNHCKNSLPIKHKFTEEEYDIPDPKGRNPKPDFSGEDRAFLNKYGPTLKEIEGEVVKESDPDFWLDRTPLEDPDEWLDDYGWRD